MPSRMPGRICMLTYDGFVADPAGALESLLLHSRMPYPRQACQASAGRDLG